MEWAIQLGLATSKHWICHFMTLAYRESFPEANLSHLNETINRYWNSHQTHWLAKQNEDVLGALWLGRAIDQETGLDYTQIFLIYVDPRFRRNGIGTALLNQAQNWAIQQGDRHLGIHVFCQNAPARSLYAGFGFEPKAIWMMKPIEHELA